MKKLIAAVALLLAGGLLAPQARGDSTTSRMGLTKPSVGSTNWGTKINTNYDVMDASAAIQGKDNTFTSSNTFNGPTTFNGTVNLSSSNSGLVAGSTLTVSSSATLPATAFNGDMTIRGSNALTTDTDDVDVSTHMSVSGNIDVTGGINAGSGDVGIVGSDGRIPGFSSTYFANMSGANITNIPGIVGEIRMYVSVSTPTNWMVCHGQSLSTTTYASLFGVIGYSYGGAGANFNIPDLRGRAPIGAGTDSEAVAWTIGTSTGSSTMTSDQMPTHTHTQNAHTHVQDAHQHGIYLDDGGGGATTVGPEPGTPNRGNKNSTAVAATNQYTTATNNNSGSSARYRPMELVVNFIIYAGQ